MVAIGVFCTFAMFVGIGWLVESAARKSKKADAVELYSGVKP